MAEIPYTPPPHATNPIATDPNRAWAQRWETRIRRRMCVRSKGEEDQSPWCASSDAAVADVCMLHLLLSSLDTHFERAGAGVEIADAALVYLDRTRVPLTRRTSYKLVAVATLLAVKVDDDFSLSNASWAECVDMSLSELNALERAFCASVDWRFYVFTTT